MTPQRRARIFAMRGGICGDKTLGDQDWGCGRKLRSGDDWQVEHHPALENGGEDVDEKCWVVCDWCVKDKNADDHDQAAKSRRVFTKRVVPGRFLRSRSWGR